jgi:Leucine-rich repeat (LRR) protein
LYISRLKNLVKISGSFCGGQPAFIQLSRLTLSNMERLEDWSTTNSSNIERLPQDLCILPKLQYLNLSCCSNLESLPQDLGELTELQNLCLSGTCKLNVLPECLGKLTNLVHLDLSQRPFVMAEALSGLTKLKYLNLSGSLHNDRQAQKTIDHISTLTNLEHLDLSWNFFRYLPSSLGNLKRLHVFDISGCKHLSSIPVSLKSIDSLDIVYRVLRI